MTETEPRPAPALDTLTTDVVDRLRAAVETAGAVLGRLRAERDTARRDRDRLLERLRDAGFPDR